MEIICGDSLMIERSIQDRLNRTVLDLSLCFQQTILTWIPAAYMLVGFIPYLYTLRQRVKFYIVRTWLNISKMVFGVLVVVGALSEVALRIADHFQDKLFCSHQIIAPSLIFLSTTASVILVEFERRKSVRTSLFLAGYWVFCAAMYTIRLRSAVIRAWYQIFTADFIIICLCCFLCVVNMILSFIVDKAPVFYTAKKQQGNPCPSSSAPLLSRLFFLWPSRTIWQGFKEPLGLEDMWDLPRVYTCQYNHDVLNSKWQEEINKVQRCSTLTVERQSEQVQLRCPGDKADTVNVYRDSERQPSLFKAILKAFWFRYFSGVLLQLIHTLVVISIPYILRKLISFAEDLKLPVYNGVMYAFLLLLASLVKCLLFHHMIIIQDKQGHCLSSAVKAMIYRKSLKLTPAARKESTTGEILNLASSDCNSYFELMTFFRTLCNFPLHIGLTMALLWDLLGPSAMVGLVVILLVIPANVIIGRLRKKIEVRRKRLKDSRMKETNEVINGIKIIKLHAWESSFKKRISDLRKEEVKLLKYGAYLMALSDCIHSFMPFLVALCTFAVYVLSSDDHILTAEKAFVSLAYFQILQQPLVMISRVFKDLVHTFVCHKRVYAFLRQEELDPSAILRTGLNDYSVVVRHGSFSWSKNEDPVLKNIELLVLRGGITAIVGNVGSGKSSLLSACLGEMVIKSGTVNVKGSVAYVAQHPWLTEASVRDNILFQKEYDKHIYEAVIRECALTPDLDVFPAGDLTQIGEKGLNLSGGQRMRISLARAVYQDRDVYFLDDPFSALDANVARYIFDRVIGREGMLKNKTRILVSQTLWLLPQVDQIIVLQNGEICEAGTYASLMENRSVFFQLYTTFSKQNNRQSASTQPELSVPAIQRRVRKTRHEIEPNYGSGNSSEDETMAIMSLPEGLDSQSSDASPGTSGRPRSMMFVRSIAGDGTKIVDPKHRTLSKSWRRTRDQLKKRLVSIQNKLEKSDIETGQKHASHYFVSEADVRRENSTVLPDEPAQEHVDLEEENDQMLLEENSKEDKNTSTMETNKKKTFFIREEELEKGRVKMIVYAAYLRAIGLVPCLFVLILCLLSRGLDIASSVWLAKWSDHMSAQQHSGQTHWDDYQPSGINSSLNHSAFWNASQTYPDGDNNRTGEDSMRYYIGGYAFLGVAAVLVSASWMCVSTAMCLRAGIKHHASLVDSIMSAPMSFFENTPTGRILNRFGPDITTIDLRLPSEFGNLIKLMVGALGCIVVVTMVTPWSLVAWVVLGGLFSFVQVVFVPNLRQVRRLISSHHSHVYSQFTETLQGVTSIRAFSVEATFTEIFYSKVNTVLKILYVGYHFNRLLSVVIEGIGASSVFVSALLAVLARDRLSAGLLALSLTYVSQITNYLNWLVRLTSACESDIVSVERIKQYTDTPPEGSLITPTITPDNDWPRRGAIELKNYSTSYSIGSNPVLKRLSCVIYPGEKIGVVGRTGAGKTTLTLALFRIIEASGGEICIDGINIADIPLKQLRKRLTIIPQDPVLFSGTLRFNLDPFNVYKEDDLWRVLKLSHLAGKIEKLPGKLNFICSEGGHNLSAGQRQLLCLARALLRKSQILILDEPTASCDVETDDVIQKTIRSEFAPCTVITVAHRLNTVKDYDRIMVLDKGFLKEMDTPQRLMDDPTTLFYALAKNAGLIQSAFHRH